MYIYIPLVCQSLELDARGQLEQARQELKDKQELCARQRRETTQLSMQLKAAQVWVATGAYDPYIYDPYISGYTYIYIYTNSPLFVYNRVDKL